MQEAADNKNKRKLDRTSTEDVQQQSQAKRRQSMSPDLDAFVGGDGHRPTDELEMALSALAADDLAGLSPKEVLAALGEAGLDCHNDPRLSSSCRRVMHAAQGNVEAQVPLAQMVDALRPRTNLVTRALTNELVVTDWDALRSDVGDIYKELQGELSGEVATYIPQLAKVDPNMFAVSVCTVDGQVAHFGDFDKPFCVQSCSKPISYALALHEHGPDKVHQHVGREPSGRGFNEIALKSTSDDLRRQFPKRRAIPHNPMINAGAIMVCSLIRANDTLAGRHEHYCDVWSRLCGSKVGFDGSTFLSERETADRNRCLAYMMRESGAFADGVDLDDTLEFYFQTCSVSVSTQMMAQCAAVLAGGGVHPFSGERLFEPCVTRNCLSLMLSCGMYDYSGEWAFRVGLPAKSGVSGCVFIVVPNVMGIAIWSPRLDSLGNSVRGVQFALKLVSRFAVHHYDILRGMSSTNSKMDICARRHTKRHHQSLALLFAAANNDVLELRSLLAAGTDVNLVDYDRRTALHIAAAEGQLKAVRFLLDHGANPNALDRWNHKPEVDAESGGHTEVVALLRARAQTLLTPVLAPKS